MEMLQLFNKSGEKLNKVIERGNKNLQEDEYIKLATVWVKSQGKYLIQKCSAEKGGEYATSGGHVQAGKTSEEQAVLELEEELNLVATPKQLKFLGNIYRPHAIFDVYLMEDDNCINQKFVLQEEEVEGVIWLTQGQIEKLIQDGAFRATSAEQFEKFIANHTIKR